MQYKLKTYCPALLWRQYKLQIDCTCVTFRAKHEGSITILKLQIGSTCAANLYLFYNEFCTSADYLRWICTFCRSNGCCWHCELHCLQCCCMYVPTWPPYIPVPMEAYCTPASIFHTSKAVTMRFTTKISVLKYLLSVRYIFQDNSEILSKSLSGAKAWDALHCWKQFFTVVGIPASLSHWNVTPWTSVPSPVSSLD